MATFRRLPSGKVYVEIRRRGCEPIYRTFPNKTEANAWARDVEQRIWEKTYAPKKQLERVLLENVLRDYEQNMAPRLGSIVAVKSRLKTICARYGDRPIGAITPEDVIAFVDWRNDMVSGETIRKELSLWSRVFDYASSIKKLPLSENPITTARKILSFTNTLDPGTERDRRISDEEIDRIAQVSESRVLGKIIRFIVQGVTAMRRGEIVLAKREHVQGQKLVIPKTKTKKPREIPLSDVALEILDSLPFRDHGLIFGVRPDSITHAFERAVRRAGINDITFHDTRHEATSRLFELGLGVQEVAAITGHDDWESLKRYTHPKADRIREKIMRQSS